MLPETELSNAKGLYAMINIYRCYGTSNFCDLDELMSRATDSQRREITFADNPGEAIALEIEFMKEMLRDMREIPKVECSYSDDNIAAMRVELEYLRSWCDHNCSGPVVPDPTEPVKR